MGSPTLPEARHICLAFDNALLDGLGRRQVLRHLTQKKVLYAQHCSDIVDETLDQLQSNAIISTAPRPHTT